jgi:Sulfotransferase family
MNSPLISSGTYQAWMKHLESLPVVALITTGRTGSDFLQSLIDSHPQVSTFNGHFAVYSEFFTCAHTFIVEKGDIDSAADEFIGQYIYKLNSRFDIQEAKDRLGENNDQFFKIDTDEFKQNIVGLLYERDLNSHDFLLAVYGAYSLCLGQDIEKIKVIFHHPHLDYEFKLFYKDFPQTRIIFSTRDPRANFCSHVEHFRQYYQSHDNQQHLYNCLKMALEDSEIAQHLGLEYTSTRLEDLPREDIMRELAKWLGVEYKESLLRSTWAGLDWHGDRVSKKIFKSTGWSETRTENGWSSRLGRMEQYILNYIMNDRLKKYNYQAKPINMFDSLLVGILINLPFKYERRFFSPSYVMYVLRSGNNVMFSQMLLSPVFYWRRIKLCYRFYFRTLLGHQFKGKWIESSVRKDS